MGAVSITFPSSPLLSPSPRALAECSDLWNHHGMLEDKEAWLLLGIQALGGAAVLSLALIPLLSLPSRTWPCWGATMGWEPL